MDTQTNSTKTAREIWDADPELQAEFSDNFEAFEAYDKNLKAGNIKIFKKGRLKIVKQSP